MFKYISYPFAFVSVLLFVTLSPKSFCFRLLPAHRQSGVPSSLEWVELYPAIHHQPAQNNPFEYLRPTMQQNKEAALYGDDDMDGLQNWEDDEDDVKHEESDDQEPSRVHRNDVLTEKRVLSFNTRNFDPSAAKNGGRKRLSSSSASSSSPTTNLISDAVLSPSASSLSAAKRMLNFRTRSWEPELNQLKEMIDHEKDSKVKRLMSFNTK